MYIAIGLAAGVLSGLVGIGGGILVVPSLVFLAGFVQHKAQGTTLAMMIPPIGLLAAWTYYRAGNVDLRVAALLCAGFFLGGLVGARFATSLTSPVLEKVFGVVLLAVAVKMIFFGR